LISQKDAGVLELESYWFKGLESSCCNHEKFPKAIVAISSGFQKPPKTL
jgi:hypothetical protein